MQEGAKILVIRFSSIGDIVLTTPVVRALKQQLYGETTVHYLTKKTFAPILEGNPYIDKIYSIEKDIAEVEDDLFQEGYTQIIDLHSNFRSAQVKRLLRITHFSVKKLNFKKMLLVAFGMNKMPDKHIVDRYMDTLIAFGVKNDGLGLDYFIPDCDRVDVKLINSVLIPNQFLCFVIGGAHLGKKMSVEKIVSICSKIDFPIVLLGGKDDVDEANKILENSSRKLFSAVGNFSINQSASIVQQSRMVLAGDTGLMHIAAALKKPVISLWGCTTPDFGMSPYMPVEGSLIIQPHGRDKRPCSKLGNHCKYGMDDRCILHVEEDEVVAGIEKLLFKNE